MNPDGLGSLTVLAAADQASPPGWVTLFPFFLMFVILYFLLIRPQKRKEAERQQLLNNVRKNDRVVTIGGIHGQVVSVRGDEIVLKLDKKGDVRVTFNKSAVSRIVTDGDDGSDSADDGETVDTEE